MNWERAILGGINDDEYLKYRKINKKTLRKSREHIHTKNHEREALPEEKVY